MKLIQTQSTSSATMDVSPIVLRENEITRLVFYPTWVSVSGNSLRGGFRFQRKSPKETWEDVEHRPMSSLKKDEGYELNLDGSDMVKLFSRLEEIKELLSVHGHHYGIRTFKLSEANASGIFLQIGDIENREWVINQLKALEDDNFENLGSAIGRARLENVIEKFEKNILNTDEKFWQSFFEEYPWILQQVFAFSVIFLNGETYLGGKSSKGRQGSGGSATDFLFMNGSNGSLAVVEVKTPGCELIGSCYRGDEGSGEKNEIYRIHGDLTGGIVQMENQIHVAVEYFKTQLGEDFPNINHLNPSGVLIAGNYSEMNQAQQKSFDLFRKSLGKNQVFTFDEVLMKLKLLKSVYEI
jgi:hypothetical protein